MNEKVEKLKQLVRIEEYAEYLGFHVVKKGNYYTLQEHDSVILNPRTNRFFRNSSTEEYAKGSVINFAMYFGNMDYKHALEDLENYLGSDALKSAPLQRPPGSVERRKKMLMLPPRGGSRKHAYAYLSKQRRIDTWIIDYFFASNHLYEDEKKNCVFVSYDEKTNKADFACKRGTLSNIPFKGDVEGSNYDYCFRLPCLGSKILYVTEAVIDVMSLMTFFLQITQDKKAVASNHYLALASTQKYLAIFNYIELHPEIETVYLAFDNDEAGRNTVTQVVQVGKERKCRQTFVPYLPKGEGMDWNDVIKQ